MAGHFACKTYTKIKSCMEANCNLTTQISVANTRYWQQNTLGLQRKGGLQMAGHRVGRIDTKKVGVKRLSIYYEPRPQYPDT